MWKRTLVREAAIFKAYGASRRSSSFSIQQCPGGEEWMI